MAYLSSWWIAFNQDNTLHLISIGALHGSADAYDQLCCIHGLHITGDDGTIAQFYGIVGGYAKLEADASSRDIVGRNLQWKSSRIEAFLC